MSILRPGSLMGWCCKGCKQMVGAMKRNTDEKIVLLTKLPPAKPCPQCEGSFQLGWWSATTLAATMGLRVVSESDRES